MLTGPQRKFCAVFAVDQNGTAAYAVAYPRANRESAQSLAAKLLKRPYIVAEIQRVRAEAERCAGRTHDTRRPPAT